MTFEKWMGEVDQLLTVQVGLPSVDLRDVCWDESYDDGLTPEEAIEEHMEDLFH